MKRFNLPQHENSFYRILSVHEFGPIPFCIVMFKTGGGHWRGQLVVHAAKGNWHLESPRATMVDGVQHITEGKPGGAALWRENSAGGLMYKRPEWTRPKRLNGISETWFRFMVNAVAEDRAAWA